MGSRRARLHRPAPEGPAPVEETRASTAGLGHPRGLGDLGGEVLALLGEALTQLEAREATDADVLADPRDGLGDDLLDGLLRVLHEVLLQQADVLEVLVELAL